MGRVLPIVVTLARYLPEGFPVKARFGPPRGGPTYTVEAGGTRSLWCFRHRLWARGKSTRNMPKCGVSEAAARGLNLYRAPGLRPPARAELSC